MTEIKIPIIPYKFKIKKDWMFRCEISEPIILKDVSDGICIPFLPDKFHIIDNSNENLNGFLVNSSINIAIEQHFPYETAETAEPTVAYMFIGKANIDNKSKKINLIKGILIILGNNTYGQNNFDTDAIYNGEYDGSSAGSGRINLGSFIACIEIENNNNINSMLNVYGAKMSLKDSHYIITYPKIFIDFLNGGAELKMPNPFSTDGYLQQTARCGIYTEYLKDTDFNIYFWTNNELVTKEQQTIICIYNNQ